MPLLLRVLAIAVALGCASDSTAPAFTDQTQRALFIGNSYLYTEEIPEIVQALADVRGDKLEVTSITGANLALIDHWNDGGAAAEIRKGGWDWVVLQQGPSSVELNRDTLRLATRLFAEVMAEVNARPALFSAWPGRDRPQDFDRAIESYRLAASDVDGIFLPVAPAWLAAWNRDPGMELYADNLHPSEEGAYLAALVVYARLVGQSPLGVQATLTLRSGRRISIPSERAAVLQQAADEALNAR